MKRLALAAATVLVAWGGFWITAINTLCDDDYWPDW